MEPTIIETPDLDHITYEDYDHVYLRPFICRIYVDMSHRMIRSFSLTHWRRNTRKSRRSTLSS